MPRIKWDVIVDSSIELLQKPDGKLFELAEKRANAKGQEILLIDNGAGHVKEAKVFGWQTFLYDSTNHEAACHELAIFLQTRGLLG